jgi:hypothetical protein
MIPQTHFMILLPKTSRTLGIFRAHRPNTIQASTFPNTQIREGITPYVRVMVMPFINEPIPAHVAQMLSA